MRTRIAVTLAAAALLPFGALADDTYQHKQGKTPNSSVDSTVSSGTWNASTGSSGSAASGSGSESDRRSPSASSDEQAGNDKLTPEERERKAEAAREGAPGINVQDGASPAQQQGGY